MLSDRSLSCIVCLGCPVCPVCNVGILWPNGWTDQDQTWQAGRPRPWPHCVRWVHSSPSLKGERSPQFSAHIPYLLWPNGWMDQDATWYGGRPRPRRHCVKGDPAHPLSQKGAEPPIFGQRLLWPNGCMDKDATWPRRHYDNHIYITQPSAKYVYLIATFRSPTANFIRHIYGHVTSTMSALPQYGHRSLEGYRLPHLCSYSWPPCVYGLTP